MLSSVETTGKAITLSEFTALLQNYYDKVKNSTDKLQSMSALLRNSGYSIVMSDIKCSQLPAYLYHCLLLDFSFIGMMFNRCELPRSITCKNCVFVDCDFVDIGLNSDSTNCIFYPKDDSSSQALINMGFHQGGGDVILSVTSKNPVIGVVYFPSQGTYQTDKIINILKEHRFNILKVDESFLSNPLTKNMSLIDGIVLSGGSDIITDPEKYSSRERLESFLITAALQHQIPTLGVCRGHQFIGHYFGAEVKNISDHKSSIIHVSRDNSSKLFALAEKKFKSQERKRKLADIEQEEEGYKYKSVCLHKQGLFFKELSSPDKKLKITAKAEDGLPESLQVGDHIISFQHHHEDKMRESSMAKSVMRLFVTMVVDYHEKKQLQGMSFKM